MIYYRRFLHDKLVWTVSQNKVRLIFGARQVGKTVLMNNVIPKEHVVLYNLQDISVRRRLERDPAVLPQSIQPNDHNQLQFGQPG